MTILQARQKPRSNAPNPYPEPGPREFSDVVFRSMIECMKWLERFDYSDQSVDSRAANRAAWLINWLKDDPRVMDFFQSGLPQGPVYSEVRGAVEAQVLRYEGGKGERYFIRLWHACVDES